MRKLKRSIAKARMQEAGFVRMFEKTKVEGTKGESVFARKWRQFVSKRPKMSPNFNLKRVNG